MRRLATAAALLCVAIYLIFWANSITFFCAAVIMGAICYWEYSGLVAGHKIQRPGIFGFLAGVLILFWPAHTLAGLTLLVIFALATALRYTDLRDVLPQVACALLGALYAFAPWKFATLLRGESVHWLFFALALNWAGDSLAYYIGRRLGRHKLAPVVSPKKSWEGAIASIAGSVIFGVLYMGWFMRQVPIWEIVLMSVVGNVAGQFGDLAESAMKRGAGLKDSSKLLPGHGGMLDRVDSSLFALPVIYLLLAAIANPIRL